MKIYRVKGFTTISNVLIQDIRLSAKARFLMCYMLSLPSTWKFNIRGLSTTTGMTLEAVGKALKELEQYHYLLRKRLTQPNGLFGGIEYIFFEEPSLYEHLDELQEQEKQQQSNLQDAYQQEETEETKYFPAETTQAIAETKHHNGTFQQVKTVVTDTEVLDTEILDTAPLYNNNQDKNQNKRNNYNTTTYSIIKDSTENREDGCCDNVWLKDDEEPVTESGNAFAEFETIRPLTPSYAQEIQLLIDDYGDNYVCEAIRIAKSKNIPAMRLIRFIESTAKNLSNGIDYRKKNYQSGQQEINAIDESKNDLDDLF